LVRKYYLLDSRKKKNFKLAICYSNKGDIINFFILGPPGTGKTYVLRMGLAYAIGAGLNVELTSLTCETSNKFGGSHLHELFPFTVNPGSVSFNVKTEASNVLNRLKKDPSRLVRLQRMDCLVIEEIGTLSAQQMQVMDIVLQLIMENEHMFGGKLLLGSGDHKQLKPPEGTPFWCSVMLVTGFKVVVLKEFVRSAEDELLQRVIQIARKTDISEDEISEVLEVIRGNCHHVSSFDDVPQEGIQIVGTRKKQRELTTRFVTREFIAMGTTCMI